MLEKITLLGLNDYDSDTLWKNLTIPEGIDKDVLINTILDREGEFPLLHPDLNYMSWAIGVWSKRWQRTMEKWLEVMQLDYNPIENYDRIENWTDTGNGSSNSKRTSNSSNSSTTIHGVSAYNENEFQNDSNDSLTESISANEGINSDQSQKNIHDGRVHGNIGVTTSQQMARDQLDLVGFNLYENISLLFRREFCIGVYF